MKHGLVLPNMGAFADPHVLSNLARSAEEAGFDGVFVSDTVELEGFPICDVWIALSAIATATKEMNLGPLVLALARHRPWVVARQVASLDLLSSGRLILGVGAGFGDSGFTAFGESSADKTKARKLDEGLAIVTGLLTGRPFSFSGSHYRVSEMAFTPTPVQGRVPIWIAANRGTEVRGPFHRALAHDGILGGVGRHNAEEIRAAVRETKGDGARFDIVAGVHNDEEMADIFDHLAECEGLGITWIRYEIGSMYDTVDDLDPVRRFIADGPPAGAR